MRFIVICAILLMAAVKAQLSKRAVVCSDENVRIPASSLPQATSFCNIFLGNSQRTVTLVNTPTVTRTSTFISTTSTTYTTSTPSTVKIPVSTTVTYILTTLLPSSTITRAVPSTTSTVYLDDRSSTVTVMRRSVPTGMVVKRAQPTPSFYTTYGRYDLTSACRCLNIPTGTITRTMQGRPTVTQVTRVFARIFKMKTILPTITANVTITSVRSRVYTPPAPTATVTAGVAWNSTFSCPPSHPSTTYSCPPGTGADTLANAGYLTCPVTASDGYSGSCQYSSSSGAPNSSGSTLTSAGSSRAATYGEMSSDCPIRADYSCL